jgi:hypothetical protein
LRSRAIAFVGQHPSDDRGGTGFGERKRTTPVENTRMSAPMIRPPSDASSADRVEPHDLEVVRAGVGETGRAAQRQLNTGVRRRHAGIL